jgi:SAM-dependent methyltransferase
MDRLLELTYHAEQSHFWFRGFRWFVLPELTRALAGRDRPRLLDCGCGTGSNLQMLSQFGDAYGFDLTWNGLEFAHSMGQRHLARASIGAVPFPDRAFDVVTSFDVFQCLPEPVESDAIRELWRVLKPGGQVILNVAALDVLKGNHSTLSEEVRRYTPGRLRRVVESAGFVIERLTFTQASLFPIMLPVRVLQRWKSGGNPPAGEFDISVPPAPINAALTALVGLEAAALRLTNMPIGGSLLVRARKPS